MIAAVSLLGVHCFVSSRVVSRLAKVGPYGISVGQIWKMLPRASRSSATHSAFAMSVLLWNAGIPASTMAGYSALLVVV